MKRRLLKTSAVLAGAVLALTSCGSPASEPGDPAPGDTATDGADGDDAPGGDGETLTLWLMGGDTPDELRDYLKDTFSANTGGELVIEEQD